MALYNSYIKNSENGAIDDLILIKTGASPFAFFFNILWFLYHRMWKESGLLLFIGLVLFTLADKQILSYRNMFIIMLGLVIVISINANYWYGKYLQRRNYKFTGCIFGRNRESAKLKFVENYLIQNPQGNDLFSESILDPKNKKKIENYFSIQT